MWSGLTLGVLVTGLLALAAPAAAQGHIFHGVGAINTSMGGAGVALPLDPQATLMLNPALMSATEGHQVTLSVGFVGDGTEVGTRLGSVGFSLTPTHEKSVIPAFGWVMRRPNSRVAYGAGVFETAGFHTDYPQDNRNPLTLKQPLGFGRISSDYRLTRIPLAVSFQATPRLSIGGAVSIYHGRLSLIPLFFAAPNTDPSDVSYLSSAGGPVSRFAVSFQTGAVYQLNDTTTIGASWSSPNNAGTYKWNGTNDNPGAPEFGEHRLLEFGLDAPSRLMFGVGLKVNERTRIAVDGQWTDFEGTDGFKGSGGVDTDDRFFEGFGWRNVWTFKTGIQYQATEHIVVRGGYNQGQTPIREEIVTSSVGNPATYGQHFTVGVGAELYTGMSADLGLSFAPRKHVRGPLLDLKNGVVPDSEVDLSNATTSLQFGVNFRF